VAGGVDKYTGQQIVVKASMQVWESSYSSGGKEYFISVCPQGGHTESMGIFCGEEQAHICANWKGEVVKCISEKSAIVKHGMNLGYRTQIQDITTCFTESRYMCGMIRETI
jgi:hypothetical protein